MKPIILDINKEGTLLNKNLSTKLEIKSDVDQNTALAIAEDKAITSINLPFVTVKGSVSAETSAGGKKIQLKNNNELTINGEANAGLRLGVFDNAESLETDVFGKDAMKVNIPALEEGEVYVLFSMNYGISADAEASWAFTGGKVNAGFDGDTAKRQTVIRKYNKSDGVRTALLGTIGSLRAANKLTGPGNDTRELPDNTTLLVRTDGSLGGNLGVSAGYDFNWVYESKAKGLEGNIGLKSKLAGSLKMNFQLSGTFVLGVSNTGGEVIALQTYRERAKGWGFAADLSASIKGDFSDVEKDRSVDEILKATLGIQHAQIFDDLKKIREVLDPDKLKEKINGFTKEILDEITTGKFGTAFNERKKELLDLIDKWDDLGADAGAQLWKLLDDATSGELTEIRTKIKEVAGMSDEEIEDFLKENYANIGFLQTPLGKLIDDLIPEESLIDTLMDSSLLKDLQEKVKKLSGVLELEDQVKKLHGTITEKLGIEKAKELIKKADPEKLGSWLEGKLSELTENVLDKLQLEEIDDFIKKVETKKDEISKAIKKALNEEYGFSIAYSYQKDSDTTALIDAVFDFENNRDAISEIFQATIKGNYDDLLRKKISGITLKKGVLTSKIKRQSSLSLTLPFAKSRFQHINQSLAKGEFIDEKDGRLAMFSLAAEDQRIRRDRMSELGVDLLYHAFTVKEGIDQEKEKSLNLKYSFRLAKENFKKGQLEQIVTPFVNLYIKEAFNTKKDTPKETPEQWVDRLHDMVQKLDDEKNKAQVFGDTLLRLSVNIPSNAGKAWFNVPNSFDDPLYLKVAAAVQARLKNVIAAYFLDNDEELDDKKAFAELFAILMYKNAGHIDNIKRITRNGNIRSQIGNVLEKQMPRLFKEQTFRDGMLKDLKIAKARFEQDDNEKIRKLGKRIVVSNYSQIDSIAGSFNASGNVVRPVMRYLIRVEKKALEGVYKSAYQMVGFKKGLAGNSAVNIQEVIDQLRDFGATLTDEFNNIKIRRIARRADYNRYIGPEIFLTVSRVLDTSVSDNTLGALQLIALKSGNSFDEKSFLEGTLPESKDVILSQLIVDAD